MKILIEGENLENYYAKVHEACKSGLRALFGAKCYGKGYSSFDPQIKSFLKMKELLFGNDSIDLVLLTGCWNPKELEKGLYYTDLDKLHCKKAIMLCDFWSEADCQRDKYVKFILEHDIDYIFSYFRAPFYLWKHLDIYNRLIWYPPCFDPHIFNDWGYEKRWDVGNLNAGIFENNPFYPERFLIHQKMLQMKDINYYYDKHPGTGFREPDTPLIGKSFSQAINQCKIFITTGNLEYRNFCPKYVEIMASKACMFATEPLDAEIIGLEDGVNYVRIDENNVQDKVRYYLRHEEERNQIAKCGYQFVLERYCCYAQANFVFRQLEEKLWEKKYDKKNGV